MRHPGQDQHRFDSAYLERLRAGDADTERHFIEYFRGLLRIKLKPKLRSQQSIEDVCQETFLRVFRALRGGEEILQPERIGAYVHAVCGHVLQEQYRSNKRHPTAPAAAIEDFEDQTPAIEERLEDLERRTLVRRVIADLPETDRRLMRAIFVDERDKDDVCKEFKVDRDYLRVMLHRAKLRFRSLYMTRTGSANHGE